MDKTIWDCLEKQTEGGTLLTSCGAELQELMRQIDIMVRNKKMEWESELIASQDSLAVRDQELSRARAVLDQKQQEIGVLKHQLESYESGQSSLASQYELQLNNLKSQLRNLKESHEKMIKHRSKRNQTSAEKENELTLEVERLNAELQEKRSEIVEHDKQTSEWDIRKRALQHQIECLEKQKRSIASNYERVQQQLSLSQSRLKKSNRMVEEVEVTSQTLLRKLEEELSNDKELIQQQERLIAELQGKTRELNTARHTATAEKYRQQEQADKANCRLKVLEEEVTKLQAALSAREAALRGSEHEIADLKNKNLDLITSIHTKDKIVEAMQVRSPVKRKEDELQHRVVILEASVEAMRETEKHLRDEVKLLESQLQSSKEESANLNEVLHRNDCAKVNSFNEEIRSLQIKLEEMEQSHSAQLCGMKAEVTNLTTHLHGRDANIARLNEHCSEMEIQLKDEARRRDKLDCELQTAAKHLENLRAQRRWSSVNDRDSPDKSLSEAEGQLSHLRQNYGKAVGKLEVENKQLKGQVDELKHQLRNKDTSVIEQHSASVNKTSNETDETRCAEVTRVNEVCRAYEHRIASLESKIREMESFPDAPRSNSVVLRSDDADSGAMTPSSSNSDKDARTPTPTKNFLLSIGIDPSSVNSSLVSTTMASMGEKQLHALLGITDEGFEETGVSTVDEFTADDERRVLELESRIEKHIGDMTKAMDAAMAKYLK